jgi:hypothetical protein
VGATRKLSCPPWCTGAPGFPELGEGPETVAPAVRPGSHATSPSGRGGGYGLRDARGLDTLAGGTPVCMYRQRLPGPPWVRDEPAGGAKSQLRAGWTARSRRVRAWMSFRPKWDPRGARPAPAAHASGGSDSCLIRARPAAWAVRIPPFPYTPSSHASDWWARAHRSKGMRGAGLVQATVRLLLGRRGREKAAAFCIKGMRRRERLPFRSRQQQTP